MVLRSHQIHDEMGLWRPSLSSWAVGRRALDDGTLGRWRLRPLDHCATLDSTTIACPTSMIKDRVVLKDGHQQDKLIVIAIWSNGDVRLSRNQTGGSHSWGTEGPDLETPCQQ